MMNSVELSSQRRTVVGGLPAQEQLFTSMNNVQNRSISGQVVLAVRAGRGYTLSYLGEKLCPPAVSTVISGALTNLRLTPYIR
ncbi:hypothetical protein [Deinococcus ruber]|uniref:hypothetical protein n=1 Tax=Deinococcus ruber TaxID=1848197 RepID=UPI0016667E34|nr:hypothetical protein [Deinococcus ruber]